MVEVVDDWTTPVRLRRSIVSFCLCGDSVLCLQLKFAKNPIEIKLFEFNSNLKLDLRWRSTQAKQSWTSKIPE